MAKLKIENLTVVASTTTGGSDREIRVIVAVAVLGGGFLIWFWTWYSSPARVMEEQQVAPRENRGDMEGGENGGGE